VCAEAGVEPSVFERHFDTAEELRPAFYDLALVQYRMLTEATTGYEEFSFEERLASFFYILLDALGEQRAFVQATFDSRVRYRSAFRAEVREALRALLTDDDVVPNARSSATGWATRPTTSRPPRRSSTNSFRSSPNSSRSAACQVD
jgi:AcrR family transcriptional regulator